MWQSKHISVLDQEWMLVFFSTLHTQANNSQLKREKQLFRFDKVTSITLTSSHNYLSSAIIYMCTQRKIFFIMPTVFIYIHIGKVYLATHTMSLCLKMF